LPSIAFPLPVFMTPTSAWQNYVQISYT
jgi:hypothetical protein